MPPQKIYVAQLDNAYKLAGVPIPTLLSRLSAMGTVVPDELARGKEINSYFYAGRDSFKIADNKNLASQKFYRVGTYDKNGFDGQGILEFDEATLILEKLVYNHSKRNPPYIAVIEPKFSLIASYYEDLKFDVEILESRSWLHEKTQN
ncbi:MAG: hypothetical protein ABIJ34_02130 [archaeon]